MTGSLSRSMTAEALLGMMTPARDFTGVVAALAEPPLLVPATPDRPANHFVSPLLTDMYQVRARSTAVAWCSAAVRCASRSANGCRCCVRASVQLTMVYAFWKAGRHMDHSVFDTVFRKNPFHGEFTIFAGLEEVRCAAVCRTV
jgi:hypothetical protein